jgi:type IV pilus assembly protein PilC
MKLSSETLKKILTTEISFKKNKFGYKERQKLFNDLSILFSSGIDIKTSLEIIADEMPQREKTIVDKVISDILIGCSLSDALDKTGFFEQYDILSLRVGEESGTLDKVLITLSNYYQNRLDQNRKIKGALTYPAIVLFTAILAVGFMLNFIVPMFQDVFARFSTNNKLPWITQKVIDASDFLSSYLYLIILLIISFVVLINFIRKHKTLSIYYYQQLFKIPFIGELNRKKQLSRFCLCMELLTEANIPLVESIKLIRQMIGFAPLENALKVIEQDIILGSSFHASLKKDKLFDKRMITLIKVAEEVNSLDSIFKKLRIQYEADVNFKSGQLNSFLEPIMIVVVGLLVGLILVSMYLPMFQMSTSFS